MTALLLYCLTLAWTPSSAPVGAVVTYTLLLDGVVNQTGIVENQASVCLRDMLSHRVAVQAFDAVGNASPMSDESESFQMVVQPPTSAVHLDPVLRADLDDNGVVGLSDFVIFRSMFGEHVSR